MSQTFEEWANTKGTAYFIPSQFAHAAWDARQGEIDEWKQRAEAADKRIVGMSKEIERFMCGAQIDGATLASQQRDINELRERAEAAEARVENKEIHGFAEMAAVEQLKKLDIEEAKATARREAYELVERLIEGFDPYTDKDYPCTDPCHDPRSCSYCDGKDAGADIIGNKIRALEAKP